MGWRSRVRLVYVRSVQRALLADGDAIDVKSSTCYRSWVGHVAVCLWAIGSD